MHNGDGYLNSHQDSKYIIILFYWLPMFWQTISPIQSNTIVQLFTYILMCYSNIQLLRIVDNTYITNDYQSNWVMYCSCLWPVIHLRMFTYHHWILTESSLFCVSTHSWLLDITADLCLMHLCCRICFSPKRGIFHSPSIGSIQFHFCINLIIGEYSF